MYRTQFVIIPPRNYSSVHIDVLYKSLFVVLQEVHGCAGVRGEDVRTHRGPFQAGPILGQLGHHTVEKVIIPTNIKY